MKKNLFVILGILLIIAGAAVSIFAGFNGSDVVGFAVSMFGAGVAASEFWNKRDKDKKALSIVTIIGIAGGIFILGFSGFKEAAVSTIIQSVIGIGLLIAGVIAGVAASDSAQTEKLNE